jgi:uncharacterized protein YxjI
MRYQMSRKLISFADKFTIQDDDGNDAYFVAGEVFTIGDKLSFQDMRGNELAYIVQRVLSFKTRYEIHRDGRLFAEIVKEITFIKDRYTVDIPGPNDYTVQGDFLGHEYAFLRGGREVAHASKAYFSLRDRYGIDIDEGEDAVTILATAIVIDLVNQSHRR